VNDEIGTLCPSPLLTFSATPEGDPDRFSLLFLVPLSAKRKLELQSKPFVFEDAAMFGDEFVLDNPVPSSFRAFSSWSRVLIFAPFLSIFLSSTRSLEEAAIFLDEVVGILR
jgi:hypothetical protein